MELQDINDKAELMDESVVDRSQLDKRVSESRDIRPGTFRCSDSELGGEIRTSTDPYGELQSVAKAEVFRPDGTSDVVGTVRFSATSDEARIYPELFSEGNPKVETALMSEVSEQSRAQGADTLKVWVPDNDPDKGIRWLRRGFHPQERNPGAAGVDWEKRL